MDKQLLERIIKRLKEKEMIDREYMDADDRGALEYEIAECEKLLASYEQKTYNVVINLRINKDRF